MGIYRTLIKQLEASEIQDTTFSIDAIGSRICSPWDKVSKANESQRFDIVIIGAGMFGAYCAEKLFRRDTSNKLRILVLDAGAFFLPTHVNNLPLGGMPDDVVWARPWTGEAPFVTDNNKRALAFCVGGRSLFWAGWAPELMPDDLEKWPEDVRKWRSVWPSSLRGTVTIYSTGSRTTGRLSSRQNPTIATLGQPTTRAAPSLWGKSKSQ